MNFFPYFNGRINRRDFIIGMFLFNAAYFLAYSLCIISFINDHGVTAIKNLGRADVALELGKYFHMSSVWGIFFNVFGLFVVSASIGICIRRFHDIGRNGFLAIILPLAFIIRMTLSHIAHYFLLNSIKPVYSDILLFKFSDYLTIVTGLIILYLAIQEGQKDKNRYGEVPVNITLKKILLN